MTIGAYRSANCCTAGSVDVPVLDGSADAAAGVATHRATAIVATSRAQSSAPPTCGHVPPSTRRH